MRTQRLPGRTRHGPEFKLWLPTVLLALTLGLVWYGGEPTGFSDRVLEGEPSSAIVATDSLNLRTGPSIAHPVVAELHEGDVVTLTGIAQGDFLLVLGRATSGWAASEFLVESGGGSGTNAQAMEFSGAEVDDEADSSAAVIATSLPTVVPSADLERWIQIDRSDASVSLMQGEDPVAVFPGRIGRDPSEDGFYSTAVGSFHVYAMNKELAPTPFAEDTWLTDWVGFDPVRKNGIHSPVRSADGTIREWQNDTTLGCVRLSARDAVTVFEFAQIGMRVEVVE